MLFNTNTGGDPRSFMYYKGQYYINGTIIELSDTYIAQNRFNGKKLWKYARFDHKISNAGMISYFFCAVKMDALSMRDMGIDQNTINEYAPYFVVVAQDLNGAITKIIKAISLTQTECNTINQNLLYTIEHPKSDLEYPALILAWMAYIIVLMSSLIFRQFYIIWIIASLIFFKWRKDVRRQ
jgi:hypothetical protein